MSESTQNLRVERTIDECLRARAERRRRSYRIASGEEIERGLERWMRDELGTGVRVENVSRAPGGASKENFFFDCVDGECRREMLFRLDPGESIVETHRLREFQLLRAAEGTVAVPHAIAVDGEGTRFERPAMVMAKVEGRTQPALGETTSGVGIGYEPAIRDELAADFVDSLVRLHAIDWRTKDISAFDVPPPGTIDAAAWTLNWWDRVYREDHVEEHPVIVYAIEWLRRHLPPAERIAIVHGDYRNGNFLYDDRARMTAILDWELGHLGDPHEDLGWIVNHLFTMKDERGRRLCCGLLEREPLIERYERGAGWKVDRERLRFYEILNNLKLAVITHTTGLRIARGKATHLAASMSLIHAFGHRYVTELARALGIAGERS